GNCARTQATSSAAWVRSVVLAGMNLLGVIGRGCNGPQQPAGPRALESADGGPPRRASSSPGRGAGEAAQRKDFLIFLWSLFRSFSSEPTVLLSWATPLRALSRVSCAASAAEWAAFSAASAAERAALSVLPRAEPMDCAARANGDFLAIFPPLKRRAILTAPGAGVNGCRVFDSAARFVTMTPTAMRILFLVSLLLCLVASGGMARGERRLPVRYRLIYSAPGNTSVHVRIELPGGTPASRTLVIPRAVPMGYGEEPYDRFVARVSAFDAAGKPLEVAGAEGPRWRVGPAARVEYDVDLAGMEQEIHDATDSSRARPGYAAFLGYSVFGFFEGEEERPIELQIEAPKGWPVFSTLAPAGGPLHAENFYALADSQILMGPALHVAPVHYAREKDVPLTLAFYSEAEVDQGRLELLSGEAMATVMEYFAGPGSAPFAHYTVFLEFLKPLSKEHSYGFGMEHLEGFHAALAAADADA